MKKNVQRVVTFIMAIMLVFNIYVPKSEAFAAEAAATATIATTILKWLGITIAGTSVAWGTSEALEAIFHDPVPSDQPTQSYYTAAVNPISRPTIYNPQEFNTTNTNTTNNTKIVNTYNKTITTINKTTNNYEINNYETIYYNNEYNMYYTQIDNYNYYITYAPTYTNITYIDSHATSAGEAYSYNLYYQLPDGRNSYNLQASDIWGTIFLSDFVNYDEVPEDDGQTLALYHFDGDIRDASAKNGTATYETGASYTFVDSGSFERALYWDNTAHDLQILLPYDVGNDDITIEMRLYTALNNIAKTYKYDMKNIYTNDYQIAVNGISWTDSTVFYTANSAELQNITDIYGTVSGNIIHREVLFNDTVVKTSKSTGNVTTLNNECAIGKQILSPRKIFSRSPYVLYANNKGLIDVAYYSESPIISSSYVTYQGIKLINSYPTNAFPTMYDLMLGQWVSIAYVRQNGIGKLYYNGVYIGDQSESVAIGNNIHLKLDAGYADYTYIDELRITNSALYTDDYTPSSMPYDTNLVFVLPENGVEDRIAVKSNIDVTSTRIGGVRPTYPTTGNVYISLDASNKVESIQQYNGSDWMDTDAAIYKNGTWNNLDKYDMTAYIVDEEDYPDYNDANIIGKNNIVYMLSNLTVNSGVSTIADGETFHITLSPDTGYTLPDTVQVVMDMQELGAGTDYTYSNGEITVPNVTGDLYISAAGESDGTGTYNISYALTNMMLSNQQRTENGFTATFQVAEKFDMPTSIKVVMGETELSPVTGYTFANGILTVPSVTDSVLVVAAAKVNESAITPTPGPSPTPNPGGDDEEGIFDGILGFLEELLETIVSGIGALLSSITTLLNSLKGFGTGFVEFLSSSFAFIPAEIISLLTLGVGVMIVLSIIKVFRG